MDWTGERFVPGAGDAQLWHEHAQRYALAASLAAGRSVADVGSGEGYGSAWLARSARRVVGVDIASDAVAHAQRTYRRPNLRFLTADGRRLPLADRSVELVTCFETVEHVADPEAILDELARVLFPGGILVLSTPNGHPDAGPSPNHFHLHELTAMELGQALAARFRSIRLLGQGFTAASVLWPLEVVAPAPADRPWRSDAEVRLVGSPAAPDAARGPQPTYLVALCSDVPLPAWTDTMVQLDPEDALLGDLRNQLARGNAQLAEWERELAARAEALAAADARVAALQRTLRERDLTVDELRRERDAATHARQQATVDARVAELRREVDHVVDELTAAHKQLGAAQASLAVYESSMAGRLLTRYRSEVNRRFPEGSGARQSYETGRAAVSRVFLGHRPSRITRPSVDQVVVETTDQPTVSLVIPVYGRIDEALACLASIGAASTRVPYEIVVVDDGTPGGSGDLARVPGIRLVRNDTNQGYLASTNRGAALARGEYILLLNSDTEVRAGWLDALVATAESSPDVGLVGAKLVYPDGRLAEAGGVVFADGSALNYGRGDDPDRSRYCWRRPVDYCSAACLLVRRAVWEQVGGYSDAYARGYWEDTDLAFAARAQGWQTVYEPRAVVVHHEGVSHGTAHDSLMRLNQRRFDERWKEALADQQPPTSAFRARRRGPERTVLVIDHRLPTPDRDSGSVRMRLLLRLLQESQRHVVFLPSNRTSLGEYAADLQHAGIEVVWSDDDLASFLDELEPEVDLVVMSRPEVALDYLGTVQRHLPNATIAYDMVDFHGLRRERELALQGSSQAAPVAAGEARACRAADIVIAVSETEADAVRDMAPGRPVVVVSNIHDEPRTTAAHAERRGVLFVGSGEHPPNPDAVAFFLEEILPRVRAEVPDMAFHVAGAGLATGRRLLPSHVVVHGWVPHLYPLLDSALVFVAPLRFGAGVKGKIGQAMASGVPVVTTSVGAEGLGAVAGRDLLVADDPELFAKYVVELHRDPEHWQSIADAGRALVERNFGVEAARRRVGELLVTAEALHGHSG